MRAASQDALLERIRDLELQIRTERQVGSAKAAQVGRAIKELRGELEVLRGRLAGSVAERDAQRAVIAKQAAIIADHERQAQAAAQDPGGDLQTAPVFEALEAELTARERDLVAAAEAIERYEERIQRYDRELVRALEDTAEVRIRLLEERKRAKLWKAVARGQDSRGATVAQDGDLLQAKAMAEHVTAADMSSSPDPAPAAEPEIPAVLPEPEAVREQDVPTEVVVLPAANSVSAEDADPAEAPADVPPEPEPAPASPAPAPEVAEQKTGEFAEPAAQVVLHDDDAPAPRTPVISGVRFERLVEDGPGGRVWHARETGSDRPVVVRVLGGDPSDLDRTPVETLMLARHPDVVSVLSFGTCDAGPYLLSERPVGETAARWVRRIGPLPEPVCLAIALQVARGLRHAAFHGAAHGDLSPTSVYIDPVGRVQVDGVGDLALRPEEARAPAAPAFASPERLRGGPTPDERADIYSLGAVLSFLLTGSSAYEGDAAAVARAQEDRPFPDPRAARPEVSQAAAEIVVRMTARDPDERFATWDHVQDALQSLVPDKKAPAQPAAAAPAPSDEPAPPPPSRPPLSLAIMALAPLAVAAILYLIFA